MSVRFLASVSRAEIGRTSPKQTENQRLVKLDFFNGITGSPLEKFLETDFQTTSESSFQKAACQRKETSVSLKMIRVTVVRAGLAGVGSPAH